MMLLFLFCILLSIIVYWLFGFWATLMFFFVATVLFLYYLQDLLFLPNYSVDDEMYDNVQDLAFNSPKNNACLQSGDGTMLHMHFIPQSDAEFSVLLLGQREGDIKARYGYALELQNQLKCNIFMIDYRGYGKSEGVPSEKGLYMDAQAGLNYLANENEKIIVLGQSLGGAVAIDLASKDENMDKISGLIVENTFTSIPDVLNDLFKFTKYFPKFFYKNKFSSLDKICKVKIPTLFISGVDDQLVKPVMMHKLFITCQSKFKRLTSITNGEHCNTCLQPGYYEHMRTFLKELSKGQVKKCVSYTNHYKIDDI